MGKTKGKKTKQTTKSKPWAPQANQLAHLYNLAQSEIANKPQQFYQGQMVADFSPETEQALQLTRQRALEGSPIDRAAQEQVTKTLRGDYLSGPEFQRMFDSASRQIMPRVTSQFARTGRGRGGGLAVAQTRALGDAFTDLVGRERQNMLNTASMAPQISGLDYQNLGRLGMIGQHRDERSQRLIDAQMMKHQFEQEEPFQRIGRYSGIVQGGNWGGTNYNIQRTPGQSRWKGAAGGAMQGASIGAMAGPWGALAGGVAGGLLGAFSNG